MTTYAISDVHGRAEELANWLERLTPALEQGDRLVLLGDYIDRGMESRQTLEAVLPLTRRFPEQVIALRGNHEEDFLAFLDGWDDWLSADRGLGTVRTFLTPPQLEEMGKLALSRKLEESCAYARQCVKKDYGALVAWLLGLPYYYETDRAIYVHAGIDEEVGDSWRYGPPEVFTCKHPLTTGKFEKDIISGHISARAVSHDPHHEGVYWDGQSHYFIDGGHRLLCLGYDGERERYFELLLDGSRKALFHEPTAETHLQRRKPARKL